MSPLLLLASLAFGQQGVDAHGTFPAPLDGDARDPLLLTRPGRMVDGQAYATALFEVIDSPLVLVQDDGTTVTRTPALDNVVAVNIMGGYTVHDRLRLDLLVPAFLASQSLGTGQGADLGDIRAAAMVSILRPGEILRDRPDRFELGVGIVPWLTVPSGDASAFLGQGGPAGGAQVNATLEAGRFVATGLVGPRFVPSVDGSLNLQGSDSFDLGASAGLAFNERTGVHLESMTRSPLQANEVPWRGVPSELMASVRHRTWQGFHFVAGAGGSLTPAVGSPAWRVMVGGGWGQVDDGTADPDGDGIIVDACPDEPETINGYQDDDGCPDELANLEVTATYEGVEYPEADITLQRRPKSGEPPPPAEAFDFAPVRLYGRQPDEHWDARARLACMSGSADAVLAVGDNLLDIPLVPVLDAEVTFLVVDNADKLIENATVQWVAGPTGCAPLEVLKLPLGRGEATIGEGEFEVAGTAAGYETRLVKLSAKPGEAQEVRIQLSPTRLSLQADEIRILEKVHFETNSHVIKPVSYSLLAEVAATIVAHPEFGRVEVAGHADERGPDAYNLELSGRRAGAVRDYLVKEGVNPGRMVVRGYGEERPLVEGSTEAAWSENRRVQFSILGRTPIEGEEETP